MKNEIRKQYLKKYCKEYYQKHKEKIDQRGRKYYRVHKIKAIELVGDKCFFCLTTKNLIFHEITGKDHFGKSTIKLVLENPEKFRRLCMYCHGGVHFLMRIWGISWNEIEKKFKKSKKTILNNKKL